MPCTLRKLYKTDFVMQRWYRWKWWSPNDSRNIPARKASAYKFAAARQSVKTGFIVARPSYMSLCKLGSSGSTWTDRTVIFRYKSWNLLDPHERENRAEWMTCNRQPRESAESFPRKRGSTRKVFPLLLVLAPSVFPSRSRRTSSR